MNSINQQQPEDNHQDLNGPDAVAKIKELADKSTCFFCSNIKTGIPFSTRPMQVQQIDEQGNFYFLFANDSHTYQEISSDPFVHMLFKGSDHSDFLNIYGIAEASRDEAKIDELWDPLMKTWFTEGKDDPRIAVLKVEPSEGYYWDNKHGNAVAFVKMVVGAAIGKTLDDSIEGKMEL